MLGGHSDKSVIAATLDRDRGSRLARPKESTSFEFKPETLPSI